MGGDDRWERRGRRRATETGGGEASHAVQRTLTISPDYLVNLGLDTSILGHWLGEERTAEIAREVLETFLVSFTEDGQPREGVRITVRDGWSPRWRVAIEGEEDAVAAVVCEVLVEAGVELRGSGG